MDTVYFGSVDTYVYAVDAATGKEKWKFETDRWITSSPAVAEGIVYIGSLDSRLYAVDAFNGKEIWRFKTDGQIGASPVLAYNLIFITSGDSHLYALGLNQRQGTSNRDEPMKTCTRCTSDADCEEGFSCWYKIPRGPFAGIRGSKENPGWCWNNEVISRTD
jgi:hypothetical protein